MDYLQVILTILAYGFVFVGWMANFYLIGQWLGFRKRRYRFRVCKPFLAIGWGLWIIGGSIYPFAKAQNSNPFILFGVIIAVVGFGLTIFAAVRFWRRVAEESRTADIAETPEQRGVWPPAPQEGED